MKNVVNLIGNLGNEVEVKHFDGGGKLAKFSLATTEKWTDKTSGEKKSDTQWHNIVVPAYLVDNVEKYLTTGDQIDLEGKIKYRKWEAEDGTVKYFTEIHAKSIIFLKTKGFDNNDSETPAKQEMPKGVADANEPDDLPF